MFSPLLGAFVPCFVMGIEVRYEVVVLSYVCCILGYFICCRGYAYVCDCVFVFCCVNSVCVSVIILVCIVCCEFDAFVVPLSLCIAVYCVIPGVNVVSCIAAVWV